jgi:L-lactate dehydrogenase complex protein LldG
MSSREDILNSIRGIQREKKSLPDLPDYRLGDNLVEIFTRSILANKGEVMNREEFEIWLASSDFQQIVSIPESFQSYSTDDLPEDPHQLDNLQLAILEAQFGVAENGAMWMDDSQLPHRVLPFITEHLVVVLSKQKLVDTMHQAYERIGDEHSGFGLFVAGPSKTADIEQSLVVGAHGAKSLRVVLL